MMSNKYLGEIGGAIYIEVYSYQTSITFEECEFFNNTATCGAAFSINNKLVTTLTILNSKIHHNTADDSVIYEF